MCPLPLASILKILSNALLTKLNSAESSEERKKTHIYILERQTNIETQKDFWYQTRRILSSALLITQLVLKLLLDQGSRNPWLRKLEAKDKTICHFIFPLLPP